MAFLAFLGALLANSAVAIATTVVSVLYQRRRQKKLEQELDKQKGFDVPVEGKPIHLPIVYGLQKVSGVRTAPKTMNTVRIGEVKASDGWLSYKYPTSNWNTYYDPNWTDTRDPRGQYISSGRNEGNFRPWPPLTNANGTKTGDKNQYMVMQQALCVGDIDSVIDIEVNGESWDKGTFNHVIDVHLTGGKDNPSATLSGLPSTNKFTNIAWLSGIFWLNRNDYNYQGTPNVSVFVRGQKVWTLLDTGNGADFSSKRWSNNSAEILLDYLLRPKELFGVGLGGLTPQQWMAGVKPDGSKINLASFMKAMRICETLVETKTNMKGRVNGVPSVDARVNTLAERDAHSKSEGTAIYVENEDKTYTWGGGQWVENTPFQRDIRLYECNMTVDTERSFRDNIELILETMQDAELTFSEGKYKLLLEYPKTSSEQDAIIAASYDDSDILSDSIEISVPGTDERYNRAVVKFNDEEKDFSQNSVSWPEFGDANHQKLLAEDKNRPSETTIFLPGCTNRWLALAKAESIVRTSRLYMGDEKVSAGSGKSHNQKLVKLTLGRKAMVLETGDYIQINSETASLSNEIFKVETIKYRRDFSVEVTAAQFSYTNLAYSNKNIVTADINTRYDATVDEVRDLNYDPTTRVGSTVPSNGHLTWKKPLVSEVKFYHVQTSTDNLNWETIGTSTTPFFDIPVVYMDGENRYFKVRVESPAGIFSFGVSIYVDNLAQINTNQVYTVTPVPLGLQVSWTEPNPNLVKQYEISWSATTSKPSNPQIITGETRATLEPLSYDHQWYVWVDVVGHDGFVEYMQAPLVGLPLNFIDWDNLDAEGQAAFDNLNGAFEESFDRLAEFDLENLSNTILEDARISGEVVEVKEELSASVNEVKADLTQNYYTAAQTDSAVAAIETSLSAQVQNVNANLSQNYYTVAETDSAISSSTTSLTTRVGNAEASIASATSSIDGVKAVHAIKVNNNGAVSGFGLISELDNNGNATSDFIVDADNFRVGKSSSDGFNAPFQVIGNNVFMKNAMIQDAAVGTLKIQGNAVTVPQSFTASTVVGNGSEQIVNVNGIYLDQPGAILIWFVLNQGYTSGVQSFSFRVTHDNVEVYSRSATFGNDFPSGVIKVNGNAGMNYIRLHWTGHPTMTVQASSVLLGAKR